MIPITEEFDHPQGKYIYYETATEEQEALNARSHINIRTFQALDDLLPLIMYDFDGLPMSDTDSMTMGDFEGVHFVTGEVWSTGTYGPDASLGNRPSLRLTLATGTTTTTSTYDRGVNLTNFDGEICVALPTFPASNLNLANSHLRLSDGTNEVILPFSGQGLTDGNMEAKWPISALGTLLRPTVVEFQFEATASTLVRIAALRALTADWTPTKSDINTVTKRLQPTVTRIGTIPTELFPSMWRASDPPGENDPLPINVKLAMNFFTGSGAAENSATFFLRSRREDYLTQLDLDGTVTSGTLTVGTDQGLLDDYGVQPDYGRAIYNSKPQTDYDTMQQSALDTLTQSGMERAPDLISESWIKVIIRWGTNNGLTIATTETTNDTQLDFTPVLEANKLYLAVIDLVDESIRVRYFTVDGFGQIDRENVVFDTNEIHNSFLIARRRGRVGWNLNLVDGDSYVNSIRSRGLMFGEFVSQNFESLTPVEGARLFAGATPDQLTVGELEAFNNATVVTDTFNSRSEDGSRRVSASFLGGVQSQFISFEDFENSEISLDVYPESGQDSKIGVYLRNEVGLFIPLQLPGLVLDTWNSVRIIPQKAFIEQTGAYQVVILEELSPSTFWVDNLVIRQRSVRWSARSTIYDPWGKGRNNWTEFRSLVNSETDGIIFAERDRFLQIRGQTLAQDARIDRVYAKPKYAELGRLVWNTGRKY